jgi:transmembrane sensor
MDELVARARAELSPPWDELREARVLARVLAAAEAPAQPTSRWFVPSALAGAALLLALALWLAPRHESKLGGESAQALAPARAALAGASSSVLLLADGSRALLEPGAEVHATEQSQQLVRLIQKRGRVRYDVSVDPGRRFVVAAASAEIRVVGTVFDVSLDGDGDGVAVAVERGRVIVASGEREVTLGAGESLRLSEGGGVAVRPMRGEPVAAASVEPGSVAIHAPPSPAAHEPNRASPTVAELLQQADAARARGDAADAERAFARVFKEFPRDASASSAAFSLGRLQSARGAFGAAARTFDELRRRAPNGPLAQDALAEAASSWALAGNTGRARSLATEYLARHPGATHGERMRRLLASTSDAR